MKKEFVTQGFKIQRNLSWLDYGKISLSRGYSLFTNPRIRGVIPITHEEEFPKGFNSIRNDEIKLGCFGKNIALRYYFSKTSRLILNGVNIK